MRLIIVESPAKAKTITKFLGKDFIVKSSYGHIRNLPKKEMGVDIKNNFAPHYIIPNKSLGRVATLKKLAQKADKVILASDEDREGEAISWHLKEVLNLDEAKIQRIAFHEITKSAIQKALDNPRTIDLNLVDAQQARRILDRLVGYELSPFLWKKIRRGLSAGRVQSVTLRLIVEKEKEIKKFKPQEYWTITANLKPATKKDTSPVNNFEARLSKEDGKAFGKMGIKNKKQADKIISFLEKAHYQITKINQKEIKKNPPAPYTTSTLQQDANTKLGFSAKQTMMLAQQLYEGINLGNSGSVGLITYMRTDSLNLSMESLIAARKTIEKQFGLKYSLKSPRFYKTKAKSAQEAHEAIRPTFPDKTPDSIKKYLDSKQYRLYKLIWQRMIASQMTQAVMHNITIDILASQKKSSHNFNLRANGSTIKFDGFLKIYGNKLPVSENLLPPLKETAILKLLKLNSEQKFTLPPARYSEATLVKALEENGIGRPSTYAPIISNIIERKYVEKDEHKKLYPLEIGVVVCDLLTKHFPDIVDYKFTAKMENDLDEIAQGKKEWIPVIKKFYIPFHKNLQLKSKEIKKENFQEKLDRSCPDCGGDLIVKFGRFGKFIACSNYPNCRYTEKTKAEKETEEKIKKENGKEICKLCGSPMVIKRGRYGIFLGCSNYPTCKNIKKIENKTGVKCPKCGTGEIVERKSKRGRVFYGCNAYPKCDFAIWNKPTGETCPQCQSLLIFAAKNKIKCSNKDCDFVKENNS